MNHEELVKKTSLKVSLETDLVELIVKDSFKNAHRVLSNTDISEVEIAGLGKFILSKNKLKRRLDKFYNIKQAYEEKLTSYNLNKETMTEQEFKKLEKRLVSVTSDINNLERKYLRMNK